LLDLEIEETYNAVINYRGVDSFDIIIIDDKYIKNFIRNPERKRHLA